MTLFRYWIAGSIILLTAAAMWVFAPVLFFIAIVTAGLAIVSAAMIALARSLRAQHDRER